MKYLSAVLLICIVLTTFSIPSHSETNTPYPPPVVTGGNIGAGASLPLKGADPSGSEIAADLVFVRPISLVAYLVGTGLAVVATPIGLATGTTRQIWDKLLNEPFDFTVRRPLGDF